MVHLVQMKDSCGKVIFAETPSGSYGLSIVRRETKVIKNGKEIVIWREPPKYWDIGNWLNYSQEYRDSANKRMLNHYGIF